MRMAKRVQPLGSSVEGGRQRCTHDPVRQPVLCCRYLQLLGFSDFQASLVAALFLGGTAFGAQVRPAGGTLLGLHMQVPHVHCSKPC